MDEITVSRKNTHETPETVSKTFSVWNGSIVCAEITVLISVRDTCTLVVDNIFVIPEYRNKGIGTNIMEVIDEICSNLDMCRIKLIVDFDNDIAINFYRKLGYKASGQIVDFCYEMIKWL